MDTGDGTYRAEIARTTHGAAHITAGDWGSLGFGQGFGMGTDHIGVLVDQVIKVRGERARYHGAGPEGEYLASDFGYRMLGMGDRAEAFLAAQPDWLAAMIEGYVAGVNAALGEQGAAGTLPAWCAEAPWLGPISVEDLCRHLVDVAIMASGRNLVGLIGRAEAPGADGPVAPSPPGALGSPEEVPGSNGWAFGGEATASGHGLVMANPHFPWFGEVRFWECHLRIPGTIDVYGVSLVGVPGVQMGFNADVAWAHTFSKGHRFTLARLDLVPGAPTRYRFGAEEREMTPITLSVTVADDPDDNRTGTGAGTHEVTRTLWASHHGPMVNLPLLGWGTEVGFTYRDANLDNTAGIEQFIRLGMATDVDGLDATLADHKSLPWVNTLAADRAGDCFSIDASATPNLTPGAEARFRDRLETDLVAAMLFANRIALLDGSEPDDAWANEPGARGPGLVAHHRLPRLRRRDHVVNANDSHWLTNPEAPLEGYPPLCGLERVAPSMRTRANLATVAELAAGGDVTVASAAAAALANTSFSARWLRDAVVARCRTAGRVLIDGEPIDLTEVAGILDDWDGTVDQGAVGAVLWRELMAGFDDDAWRGGPALWAEPFNRDDPVATPRGLAPAPADGADADAATDPVLAAAGRAVVALRAAGLRPDARLGDVQWALRSGTRVAVHGGGEGEAVANVLAPVGSLPTASLEPSGPAPAPVVGRARTGLAEGGYQVTYGTSFLMVVELTEAGPVGRGLCAYGQSSDPASPHYSDGTEAFAAKELRPLRFSDADIEADPTLTRRTVAG